jgi:hypothetical protein
MMMVKITAVLQGMFCVRSSLAGGLVLCTGSTCVQGCRTAHPRGLAAFHTSGEAFLVPLTVRALLLLPGQLTAWFCTPAVVVNQLYFGVERGKVLACQAVCELFV